MLKLFEVLMNKRLSSAPKVPGQEPPDQTSLPRSGWLSSPWTKTRPLLSRYNPPPCRVLFLSIPLQLGFKGNMGLWLLILKDLLQVLEAAW